MPSGMHTKSSSQCVKVKKKVAVTSLVLQETNLAPIIFLYNNRHRLSKVAEKNYEINEKAR